MRFLGNIDAKTDTKGRAFLPATFRKVLNASGEESLILRKDIFEPCLVLYPQSVWNQRMDALRKRLSRWNKHDQMIYRQFVTDVEIITLDNSGRFLIPKRYLKMVNIDQQIRFTGMDDCIEIWATGDSEQPFMSAEEFSKAMEETMGTDDFFSNKFLNEEESATTKD
ncbi:division/cell wall cluster transcriptional repressor MraZ [Prevotella veroralis]